MAKQPHSPLSIAALTDQHSSYAPPRPPSDTTRSPPTTYTTQPSFRNSPLISSPNDRISPSTAPNTRSGEDTFSEPPDENMAADEGNTNAYRENDEPSPGSTSSVRKLQSPPTNSADDESDHEFDKTEQRTKYGRTINKPEHYVSMQPISSGRKSQKRRTSTTSGFAGNTQRIFCTLCHRGNSPQHNRIVLCDRCDRPFHQQCHMPPIESITLEIEGTTWFCNQCETEREHRLSVKYEIDGRDIDKEAKMAYLLSLPKSFLMDMIFTYERNHPGLRLYPAMLKSERSRRDSLSISPPARAEMMDTNDDETGYNLDDVPSYEDMIEKALIAIGDPRGSSPRSIWEWMGRNYPLAEAFPRSASQSLQKAVKKGRFFKEGSCYKINPNYIPEPKSRRGARKPSFIGKDGTMIRPSKRTKIQLNDAPAVEPRYNNSYFPSSRSASTSQYNSANQARRLASPLEADEKYRSPIESDNGSPWRQPEKYNRIDRTRDIEDLNIREQSQSERSRDWSPWQKHDDSERYHREPESKRDWYNRDIHGYESGHNEPRKPWNSWQNDNQSKPTEWLSQRREIPSNPTSPRHSSSLPPLAHVYPQESQEGDQERRRSQYSPSRWDYRAQART
ncbi:hypothetical protein NQZ79_g1550 [Umbelopsis isabellina]|nr:hypothetical protein NQZ79_g1550 [Umbelopsis isabellina]